MIVGRKNKNPCSTSTYNKYIVMWIW